MATKRMRHFITGEWVEVELQPDKQLTVYEGSKEKTSRTAICAKRPWVGRSQGVPIEQMGEYNKLLKGTGAWYQPRPNSAYADLAADSNGARNRGLKRLGKVDFDGGWGQHTG